MALRLIIEDDEGATTIVPLGGEAVTIGRQEGNTIQLTEKNVSRRHARLWFEDSTWVIEDLDSYNGIKVNGEFIEQRVSLREGDVIQIGDYHLALAEDTARVAFGGRPTAANQQDEPILASSSAHLPVVAPDAPATESSQVVAGEVGAAPAVASAEPPADEPAGGTKAVPILVGVGIVLALGAAGFFVLRSDHDRSGAAAASGAAPPPPVVAQSGPVGEKTPVSQVPVGQRGVAPGATKAAAPPPAQRDGGTGARTSEPDGGAAAPAAAAADEDTDAVAGSRPGAAPPSRSKRRRKRRKSAAAAAPPPAPPAAPAASAKDPAELLKEARVAQMRGQSAKAYRLAAEANKIRPSSAALRVMGVAACKLGDTGKARSVYRKLSGTAKSDMAKLCARQGIDL